MEFKALIAPVTALEFLKETFLLKGEGPVLSVYNLQPHPTVSASLSVLQQYRIHGIRPRCQTQIPETDEQLEHGPTTASKSIFYDLVVFGGKAVRLVRIHVDFRSLKLLDLEILGPLLNLRDWILDARWLSGHNQSLLCVAVAHNSALLLDVAEGNVLVHSSCLESCLLYSALLLVDESWADTVVIGGTVFNELVIWKTREGDESNSAPVERRLPGHSGVIFSISYLQEKGYLASASDDRSVRVWSVGDLGGSGGKCGDTNPACLVVLYGHQARVFSVRISLERVFSAGEDGTCLVWDWAGGGKLVSTLKGHRAGGIRALAVSDDDEQTWVATGGADGGVRLWRIDGVEVKERANERVAETLTDLNFPSQSLPKVVCLIGETDEANWSHFVVCTDKGTVYEYTSEKWKTLWQGASEFHSYCVMDAVTVAVKNSVAEVHLCALGSLSGSLQVFPTSRPQSGIRLTGGTGKIQSISWQKGKHGTYLIASGADGLVHRWYVEVEETAACSVVLTEKSLQPFSLPQCAKRWLTAVVRLQHSSEEVLWICGDRRGSLLLYQESTDGRKNQVTDSAHVKDRIENEESSKALEPVSCLFGVHGKHGVTSVCEYQGLFYSTGKDGCVRIFRVSSSGSETQKEGRVDGLQENLEMKKKLQLEVLRVQRACKGMEWLEKILISDSEISVMENAGEGEYKKHLEEKELRAKEAKFVIVGFHSANFVVWDPLRQERLLTVPCGGGHRSWCLWPPNVRIWPGYGAMVFIKQGAVLTSQPPGNTFSWAQKSRRNERWTLREGVHGRGIWCVVRLGRIGQSGNDTLMTHAAKNEEGGVRRREEHWEIVVTGGEDTSLAVLAVGPVSGTVKVLSVITDHISGVRAMATVTHPGGEGGNPSKSLSALLVSAGGRAQIQSYRLLVTWDKQKAAPSCQVIQVAGHRLDELWEKKRNRHKMVKMNPETRYLSIIVVEEKKDFVLVALSCSDGAVRLFSVCEAKNRVDLLWETFYHQRCVLSLATCSLENNKRNKVKLLFSAATDGKIAVWSLNEALSSSADDIYCATTPPIPCFDIPAHQSGINSLAVWVEKSGQREGCCLVTIASGGDDGQLTVSTIKVQYPEDEKIGGSGVACQVYDSQTVPHPRVKSVPKLQIHLHSQCHVPLAHASPLTALKLLCPGLLVSTSSDQRVCLWKVEGNGISHRGALCCHVADAAGLAVWEGELAAKQRDETGFELVNAISREKESGTSLDPEEGRFSKIKETIVESKDRDPVDAVNRKGDFVCETSDGQQGELSENPRNQTVTYCSEGNTKTCLNTSSENRGKMTKVWWAAVCGQGLQLLQIRESEIDERMKREVVMTH